MKKLIAFLLFVATPAWSMWTCKVDINGKEMDAMPFWQCPPLSASGTPSPDPVPVESAPVTAAQFYTTFGRVVECPAASSVPSSVPPTPPTIASTSRAAFYSPPSTMPQRAAFLSESIAVAGKNAAKSRLMLSALKSAAGVAGVAMAAAEIVNETGGEIANDEVEEKHKLRIDYENEVRGFHEECDKILAEGEPTEEQARAMHKKRDDLKAKIREITPPEALEKIWERNRRKYDGDPEGPSFEFLRSKGKSFEDIIRSAAKPDGKDLDYLWTIKK